MAAKKRSTDHVAQARFAASVSLRLAPILDRLVVLIDKNGEDDAPARLALAERAAQLANALLVASHDTDCDTVRTAIGVAGITGLAEVG